MTTSTNLRALIEQSTFWGADQRFVQGAGGNLSFKTENSLFIKASGTRLKDASDKNIFIELDLNRSREEVLQRENLTDLIIDADVAGDMKPSIETAIHSLLPHAFVTHIHSIGAISRAIDTDLKRNLAEISDLGKCIAVDYAKPGIPLAKAILRACADENISPDEGLIALLGNHGIIAGGSSSRVVQELLLQVECRWSDQEMPIMSRPVASLSAQDWIEIAPIGTLSVLQMDLLTGGALTPDQVVFLGQRPIQRWDERDESTLVALRVDGSAVAKSVLSKDALEIAESFIQIATLVKHDLRPRYLNEHEIADLLNWDAEKWRKAQER